MAKKKVTSPKPPRTAPLMTRVKSSNVRSVGYDEIDRILYVMFLNKADKRKVGPLYRYLNVAQSIFSQMLVTSSKGKFVWTHLRDKYRYQKWGGFKWRKEATLKKEAQKRQVKRKRVSRSKKIRKHWTRRKT